MEEFYAPKGWSPLPVKITPLPRSISRRDWAEGIKAQTKAKELHLPI
jgi:hypothetical protein